MKKALLYFALTLIPLSSLFAQAQVTGTVIDADGEPLPFANVMLYKQADSSLVKAGYSEDDGSFLLTPVPKGEYWIKITFTGLAPFSQGNVQVGEEEKVNLEPVTMEESSTNVKEVLIRAERPLVQVKPDKTIFNVEGTPNAIGENAFDLLRKAPGVVIDNNDNIVLLGKQGVRIYIDGKQSPLSASDLAALLKTMQSSYVLESLIFLLT